MKSLYLKASKNNSKEKRKASKTFKLRVIIGAIVLLNRRLALQVRVAERAAVGRHDH